MTYELEPLGIVGVWNIDRREPRVLSYARMNLSNALRDEDNDVVLLQQPRAGDPTLKGNQVCAIVPGHVAHIAGRDDRVQEIYDYRNLITV